MSEAMRKGKYYPIRLQARTKSYIWGGEKLFREYGKGEQGEITAESWELSAHPDGLAVVLEGEYAGRTLDNLGELDREGFWGKRCGNGDFPLLVKLIDAERDLSIQVHPSEKTARCECGENSKTEMWYVLDAEPGSGVYLGFSKPMNGALLRQKTEDGTICECLQHYPAKQGDVFYIPAGTVHAIGAGLLIAEIQQSSNTTFRVYDYHRRGADGKERPLHMERAVEVMDYAPGGGTASRGETVEETGEYVRTRLSANRYFETEKITLHGTFRGHGDGGSFTHLLCTMGKAVIESDGKQYAVQKGDSFFLPAAIGKYSVSGECEWIATRMGKDEEKC